MAGGAARGARTLWLLRHAKTASEPPPGGSDFDRVLTGRGRRDAAALGQLFAGDGQGLGPALADVPRPAVALVSPSARTSATAELVLAGMAGRPEVHLVEALYGADPDEVLAMVRDLPDDVAAAMVVGHNPTAKSLSVDLLADDDRTGRSVAVRHGFPTCALGVYRFATATWSEVGSGTAELVALLGPPFG